MSLAIDAVHDTVYVQDAPVPASSDAHLPVQTDVLIVGGGLTGLSCAFHLTRYGFKVTLCDAGAIGDGASGRNGGQLHPGQRRDQMWLEEELGPKMANALWRLGKEATALIHALRANLNAPCDYTEGLIEAAHTTAAFDDLKAFAETMNARYDTRYTVLNAQALEDAIGSRRYRGGLRTADGGHLNPVALVNALANAAHVNGGHLIANARVDAVRRTPRGFEVTVTTRRGAHSVMAQEVVLAGNGMMRGLSPELDAAILPLRNYIVATAPLEHPLIPGSEAVADCRFVIRYFRQDSKGRMVFGGGETFGRPPMDVARFVRPYLAEVYPHLRHAPLDAAWGGTLGITRQRLPIIKRLEPGMYAAAGFSGQGVALATFAGKVLADALAGEASRLDVFSRIPIQPFPGGTAARSPLAQLAMAWFAIRDRLGI